MLSLWWFQCANVVQMGGDVGALLSAPGWLFIGLPNEVQVYSHSLNFIDSSLVEILQMFFA
jgi:hypothetical protein